MPAPSQESIRQNPLPDALPDFRNLGVMARILVAVNAAAMFVALARSRDLLIGLPAQLADVAGGVELSLLASLIALYALSPWLAKLSYRTGLAAVFVVVLTLTAVLQPLADPVGGVRHMLWSLFGAASLTAFLAGYFHLRNRAFSPALAEARLQALQARIRPHFLFNSINAVLSLIRGDPKRAEAALEDLADMFRVVMSDTRALIPVRDEVTLCRQYLNLEQLRFGDRLQVEWKIAPEAEDALMPPMLLQPLVENAVYHGIEPGAGAGSIRIRIEREGERLRLTLSNPYYEEHQHRQGNRMALANIRERLQLHFDVEAKLETRVAGGHYEIDIAMPCRTAS